MKTLVSCYSNYADNSKQYDLLACSLCMTYEGYTARQTATAKMNICYAFKVPSHLLLFILLEPK